MRVSLHLSVTAGLFFVLAVLTTPTNLQDQEPLPQQQHSRIDSPSLRLHILLKGKNIQIHGQAVVDVFAKPIASADRRSVRYDGFATFIQDDLRYLHAREWQCVRGADFR